MISDTEKLALIRASKDLTILELIEATCEACKATFINSDIARAERKACAKIADEWSVAYPHPSKAIAEQIRKRGQE